MSGQDGDPPADPEATYRDLLAYTDLVTTPPLARLYSFVGRDGPVTIDTIKEELGMPHSTAYKYVGDLEQRGILTRNDDDTPATVEVDPISVRLETEAGTTVATPVLVDAVARQSEIEEIELFVDRHGLPKLAAALDYTERIVEGDLTQGQAADELDVHRIEGSTVFAALNDVIQAAPEDWRD